ncbi:putative dehydrogenase [Escherichia coli]|nr:putative dehydrogenase [Escherichia coli]
MVSGHRFDAQTLHSFIQAVFRQMGSEEQEAKLVADHLIAANLAGHDSHGIGMIPS